MNYTELSDAELLKFAIENGMLNTALVQEKIEMQKREELLKKHPYKIWEGKNGKWYTYLPDKNNGRILKKRNSKSDIENVVMEYWKEELENPTIKEVFSEWNDRRMDLKKICNSTHLRNEQIFNRHYQEFGDRRIKQTSSDDYAEFLEEQIPKFDLTAKAFSNLKGITKGFLKRAKKRNLIHFNVDELFQELDVSDVDFKKVIKEDYEEVFNQDEMPTMMEYLKENLDKKNLAIMLMFLTGARICEVVTLKKEDFFQNTFNIRRTESRYLGKDGKYVCEVKEYPKSRAGVRTAVIPMDYSWILPLIQNNADDNEYIFSEYGKRFTTQSVRMRLKRLCRKLNIFHKSPHKIRKTYGTILLDNHIDNKLIMGQMGHTEITCTENHYHRNRRSIEQKSLIISSIPDFMEKQSDNRTHV